MVILTKNGYRRTVLHSASAVKDGNGELLYSIVIQRDITDRKQAEDDLQEYQRMLNTLMRNLPGMAYRCRDDSFWTMEFASHGSLQLTGYTSQELVDNRIVPYREVIHPGDRQRIREAVDAAQKDGTPFEIEYRILAKNGNEKWVWERGRHIRLPDGDGVLEGFVNDITERKRAEEDLHYQATILGSISDAVISADLEFAVQSLNEAA